LTKEKIQKLHIGSSFTFFVNPHGDILYGYFILDYADVNIINENDLYNLYVEFKKFKIDTTRVSISAERIPPYEKDFDYAIMGGSLVPVKYREKFFKK